MALINMERPKPENKNTEVVKACACEGDSYYEKYPYGLRINLRNEDLIKLGIDVGTIKAGDIGTLNAKIIFTEVGSNESLDNQGATKEDNRLEIQITDLEISNDNNFDSTFQEITSGE